MFSGIKTCFFSPPNYMVASLLTCEKFYAFFKPSITWLLHLLLLQPSHVVTVPWNNETLPTIKLSNIFLDMVGNFLPWLFKNRLDYCNGCAHRWSWSPCRGATGCGLSVDIRIWIRLQPGYIYHFFTSVNIHIRISILIRKLSVDTDIV